jgi:hypothetical protein
MSQHGKDAGIIIEQFDISSDLTEIQPSAQVDALEATTFGNTGHRHAIGLRDGGIQINGLYNDGASGIYTLLNSIFQASTPKIATAHPLGTALGSPAELCYADLTTFAKPIKYADLISISAYLKAAQNGIDFGVWLHALAAETTSTNGSSHNNSAGTAGGGVVTLHVTAISGGSTVTIKVQHSVNNSTWVDLVTFTDVTAVGAQRTEIASGNTIRQYTRVISTFTGGSSPSTTYAVALARR